MAVSANIQPGDVVVDLMGGSGTIPMAAAVHMRHKNSQGNGIIALTADLDDECVAVANGNFRAYGAETGSLLTLCFVVFSR